jgi:cytidylate kinase
MGRTHIKKLKPFNEATIKLALQEIRDGATMRMTARKHGMSVGLLSKRGTMAAENKDVVDMRVSCYI